MRRRKGSKYYRTDSRLIYSLPCSPLILETKGKGSHPCCDANLVITWSRNPHAKTPIPGKPSKSDLIGVWYKDNLYLSTSTIGNGDPHPTNIDSRTRSIRMTPRRQLFFDKSFLSSSQNHGREIISPTHTHTKCGKQDVLLIWIV
jgi:hypothetical protein